MTRLAILLPAPDRNAPDAWSPTAWEAAAAPIVAQALSLAPAQALIPHAPGVGMAVAAGLAKAGVPVVLVQPYRGCTVTSRDGGRTYKAWHSYWHGATAEYNAALMAAPGVSVWSPAGDADLPAAQRDAAKDAAYRAIGKAATAVVAAPEVDALRSVAIATAAARGVVPATPWTETPAPEAAAPKARKARKAKAAPALPEEAPF